MTLSTTFVSIRRGLSGVGLPGGIILATAVIFILGLIIQCRYVIGEYQKEFYAAEKHKAALNAQAITNRLTQLYQGLRTIARLPGTRRLDLESGHVDPNTIETIQEIYNNLYSNIRLSEVYLVARDFDPNHRDPHTGRLSTPLYTFDEFIVGRTAVNDDDSANSIVLPEIESYEYRLMHRHMAWFASNFPDERTVAELAYPALAGEEIITCDNSLVSPKHFDDADRSGIVYSLPFYDLHGAIKGMVSGILLTNVLRSFLDSDSYMLVSADHHYVVAKSKSLVTLQSRDFAVRGVSDPALIYSEVLPLPVVDYSGRWQLWTSTPNDTFWGLPQVHMELYLLVIAIMFVGTITCGLLVMIYLQRQQQATNQQVNRSKSEFLARMSHELRTPLNSIIGYSDIILDDAGNQGYTQVVKDVTNIRNAGYHLLALVNEVLDLSKISAGRMELDIQFFAIDAMVDTIQETITPLMQQRQNTLRTEYAADIGMMHSDEKRVRQILLNLLSNAAKFSEQGTVTLKIHRLTDVAGDLICCQVEDTGIGMTEAQVQKLFQEYTQAEAAIGSTYGGTGLGLAISRTLCEFMGGTISVQSTPGCGTRFKVLLPADTSNTINKTVSEPKHDTKISAILLHHSKP